MFKDLDPVLIVPLRLAIISILANTKEAEFSTIKNKTKSTAGNLSIQLNKLKAAGYIDVTKQFKDNYPKTTCKITHKGSEAFKKFEEAMQSYFNPTLD